MRQGTSGTATTTYWHESGAWDAPQAYTQNAANCDVMLGSTTATSAVHKGEAQIADIFARLWRRYPMAQPVRVRVRAAYHVLRGRL